MTELSKIFALFFLITKAIMQPVLRIVWNDNKGKTVQYLISDIS